MPLGKPLSPKIAGLSPRTNSNQSSERVSLLAPATNKRYPAHVGYFETPWHIILILLIALLLFGGKRLPEMGRSLGHGMREFKDAVTGKSPTPADETQPELPAAQATATEPAATTPTATPPERETV
jgi:sec-independent protein translocase protein TatA